MTLLCEVHSSVKFYSYMSKLLMAEGYIRVVYGGWWGIY